VPLKPPYFHFNMGLACKLSVDGARYALNSFLSLIKAAAVCKKGEKKGTDQRHREREAQVKLFACHFLRMHAEDGCWQLGMQINSRAFCSRSRKRDNALSRGQGENKGADRVANKEMRASN
jgi:hypothetical protein